jgi:hypothetical protein
VADLFFERGESKEEDDICWQTIGILCAIIIGFVLFYTVYTSLWELMLPSLTGYGFELLSLGLIVGIILIVYIVRHRDER